MVFQYIIVISEVHTSSNERNVRIIGRINSRNKLRFIV